MTEQMPKENNPGVRMLRSLIVDLLLVLILMAAAILRFTGIDWGEGAFLHPDEAFLANVETSLKTVSSLSEYWNTAESTLNPQNTGYEFYVYGTFPIMVARYVATAMNEFDWGDVMVIGRALSALADVATVFVVFLTAERLFDKRVGLFAAAFSAFSVMSIQLSHYAAVDTFQTFFIILSIYFAVCLAEEAPLPAEGRYFRPRYFILFGIAFGLSFASKIHMPPVALALPLAVVVRFAKLQRKERIDAIWEGLGYLVLAGFISALSFRIFQPYAFSGPGFFGLLPNQLWVDKLLEGFRQQTGDFDWPPSIQWARIPPWYSLQHMVLWGLGLPLGVAAWGGFLWSTWKMVTGRWRSFLVIWGWTAVYFVFQSLKFNPTMRYQHPVYPTLAIFAGWAVVALWDAAGRAKRWRVLLRTVVGVVGAAVLGLTAFYAFAFVQIYQRPITRLEASRWIYQNIDGPLNVLIDDQQSEELYHQPLSIPYTNVISEEIPLTKTFVPKKAGTISEITFKTMTQAATEAGLSLWISEPGSLELPMVTDTEFVELSAAQNENQILFAFETPPILLAGRQYLLRSDLLSLDETIIVTGGEFVYMLMEGETPVAIELEESVVLSARQPFELTFSPPENANLMQVSLDIRLESSDVPPQQTLRLSFSKTNDFTEVVATAEATVDVSQGVNYDGGVFTLSQPVTVIEDTLYYLQIENLTPGGRLTVTGAAISNETTWDPGLPYNLDGYINFAGTYVDELVLQITDDGSQEKLDRMLEYLGKAEYLAISSSRQWGSTTRIPERYPINMLYYRYLLGCPDEISIQTCYNKAQVGMYEGQLGYELVQIIDSNPSLFGIEINDQPSDEAFTVYDHPKVFIFKKSADYDAEQVAALLGTADVENVVRLTPKQAGEYKSLLLTDEASAKQREGGTWSELFDTDAWYNRSGLAAVALWYLSLTILGWAIFPLVRLALPVLPDDGFPLARTAAMLLLAYLSWLAGSVGVGYTRPVILTVYVLLVLVGLWQAFRQRDWLRDTLKNKWRQYLTVELVFLGAFVLVTLVRYGNPDLWHPFKGGEKPMDFAYFNAILKSVAFPAYDPWYAGGYINYYYFGFVFVGTLVKMLGIVPALAYNIVLPTVFAMLTAGAYSAAWNIYRAWLSRQDEAWLASRKPWPACAVGLVGALLTGLLGNLGTVSMVFRAMQRLAAGEAYTAFTSIFQKIGWTIRGFGLMLKGVSLPIGGPTWYWDPSRVIPALNEVEPITEFPWFSTIYADLHAHYMALALVYLAVGWVLAVVFSKAWQNVKRWQIAWSFMFAGVAIGALRPTNTWDFPTYLALGVVALVYAIVKYVRLPQGRIAPWLKKVGLTAAAVLILIALSFVLYQPFAESYGLPYSSINLWEGSHTLMTAYLVHWGVFLFMIIFWLAAETRQWMQMTPLSSLRKLEKAVPWIYAALGLFAIVLAALLFMGVRIHWLALPLAIWAAVLLLRPGLDESKRVVLFLVGTALFLTVLVEVIVLAGDISRMNTVFKFYLQAWVLLAASSAAAFGWTLTEFRTWKYSWQATWRLGVVVLLGCAAFFPLSATTAKVIDRMSDVPTHTLDGMAFMQTSYYPDEGGVVELSQDYDAIRWLQENVSGTPVIVEANTGLYRWGSRFSIYTGLPTVLGWDWHQTQQRGFVQTTNISQRRDQIAEFYYSTNTKTVRDFLQQYQVEYIILGQLERNYYPGVGLEKFDQLNGTLWQEVYRDGQTAIYRVLDPAAIVQE